MNMQVRTPSFGWASEARQAFCVQEENCRALPGWAGGGTRPYVVRRLCWLSNGADETFSLQMQNYLLGGFFRG